MKITKPNITEYEWVIFPNTGKITDKKGLVIADVAYRKNVKAISAVPDMIDALIDTLNWMDSLEKGYHSNKKVQEWINKGKNPHEKIKQALTKAGCTYEH